MAQYWDGSANVWRDDSYPDIWGTVESNGSVIWHNPQGMVSNGGPWSMPGQQQSPQQALPVGQPQVTGQNGAFQGIPGYGYTVNQQQNDAASQLSGQNAGQTSALHSQDNAAALQLQQAHDQSAMAVAQLNAQVQAETAKGNNASAERIAQLNYQIAQEQNRLQGLTVQINQAAEARQERQLQANLAANPQDFVAYEYYKRALGNPTALGAVNQNGGVQAPSAPTTPNTPVGGQSPYTPDPNASGPIGTGANVGRDAYYAAGGDSQYGAPSNGLGGSPTPGVSGIGGEVATPSIAPTSSMFNGTNYSPAPPAYGDSTLASVVNNIQNPGAQLHDAALAANQQMPGTGFYSGAPQWNPNLSGQGAFGSTINAPNQLGRADYGGLSDSEKGILTSFLNAGVNMNGHQVSIDPSDYFAQMQKSWVPTLNGGVGQQTQYSD